MIHANKLKEISANYKTISLAAIEHRCLRAAESGGNSVMIFDRNISDCDMQILQENGYVVDRMNDAEGFHYEINWSN